MAPGFELCCRVVQVEPRVQRGASCLDHPACSKACTCSDTAISLPVEVKSVPEPGAARVPPQRRRRARETRRRLPLHRRASESRPTASATARGALVPVAAGSPRLRRRGFGRRPSVCRGPARLELPVPPSEYGLATMRGTYAGHIHTAASAAHGAALGEPWAIAAGSASLILFAILLFVNFRAEVHESWAREPVRAHVTDIAQETRRSLQPVVTTPRCKPRLPCAGRRRGAGATD
jgi:hypothetical protein